MEKQTKKSTWASPFPIMTQFNVETMETRWDPWVLDVLCPQQTHMGLHSCRITPSVLCPQVLWIWTGQGSASPPPEFIFNVWNLKRITGQLQTGLPVETFAGPHWFGLAAPLSSVCLNTQSLITGTPNWRWFEVDNGVRVQQTLRSAASYCKCPICLIIWF